MLCTGDPAGGVEESLPSHHVYRRDDRGARRGRILQRTGELGPHLFQTSGSRLSSRMWSRLAMALFQSMTRGSRRPAAFVRFHAVGHCLGPVGAALVGWPWWVVMHCDASAPWPYLTRTGGDAGLLCDRCDSSASLLFSPPIRIFLGTAAGHTSSSVLDFQLPCNPLLWSQPSPSCDWTARQPHACGWLG